MMSSGDEVTRLLNLWAGGDHAANEQLFPLVYQELRRIARRQMANQNPGHTLQVTGLIHEAYMKLASGAETNWENRAHFFGVAAKAMRHVLVDYARNRQAAKHGGGQAAVPLEEALIASPDRAGEWVALDDALTELAKLNPRQSDVIELRFFGG